MLKNCVKQKYSHFLIPEKKIILLFEHVLVVLNVQGHVIYSLDCCVFRMDVPDNLLLVACKLLLNLLLVVILLLRERVCLFFVGSRDCFPEALLVHRLFEV